MSDNSKLSDLKASVIVEIYESFADAGREGGVSWSETVVLDDRGTDEERAEARAQDTETSWQELIDDSEWQPELSFDWYFLDAIGFRYYLPAAMIRCVRSGYNNENIALCLTLVADWQHPTADRRIALHIHWQSSLHHHGVRRWAALNARHKRCIKAFLTAMLQIDPDGEEWLEALLSYRENVPEAPEPGNTG